MPAVVAQTGEAVEVEHHAVRIHVVEFADTLAVDSGYIYGTFACAVRHHYFESVLCYAVNFGGNSVEIDSKRHIGVVGEV